MEETKRNRRVIIFATVVAILLVIVSSINEDNPYSSRQWLNKPEDRWVMTDEIVRTNVLVNKTYKEIVEVLGQPTGLGKPDSARSAFTTMNYFLGVDDITGLSRYLCLDLKQDSVVFVYKYFCK